MDGTLKNLGYTFQILAHRLEAMAENLPWMTSPAKNRLIEECFGTSKLN